MWLDERLEFADATSVGTPNNSTVLIGDVIDLTVARDIGAGQPIYMVVQVTTAVTSGGSATVQFSLASDAAAAIATDGTQTIHFLSDAYPVADLTAGAVFAFPLPLGYDDVADYERYIGFQIVETAGQALTAGNVNAFLTQEPKSWKSYADATN